MHDIMDGCIAAEAGNGRGRSLQSKQRLLQTSAADDHVPDGVTERLHLVLVAATLEAVERRKRIRGRLLKRCRIYGREVEID